ncbi:MAG: pentapeptide repeat-containing protein [Planctomycetes bacterium]|nr:pentapeptide repeat-containing protein [Planctomycetota bacterium]
MHHEEVCAILRSAGGVASWNSRRVDKKENPSVEKADLAGANLVGIDFSDTNLADADLRHANLKSANLSGADLTGAKLESVDLTNADLTNARLKSATMVGAKLFEATLTNARLSHANLEGASLVAANLRDAALDNAKLSNARLGSADLRGANLLDAQLISADLRNASVDSATIVGESTDFRGCKIDRYTMEYLRGDLKPAQLMDLQVTDDIAVLRSQYSGVWMWIHLLSLAAFCSPYVWFFIQQWSLAAFQRTAHVDASTIPMWEAVLRYIVNGGSGWRDGWNVDVWSFGCFCLVFAYNAVRGALLWKTKRLETQQDVSGLPVKFSLHDSVLFWLTLYQITVYGYWIMLALVLFNTFHFLTMRIPIALPG